MENLVDGARTLPKRPPAAATPTDLGGLPTPPSDAPSTSPPASPSAHRDTDQSAASSEPFKNTSYPPVCALEGAVDTVQGDSRAPPRTDAASNPRGADTDDTPTQAGQKHQDNFDPHRSNKKIKPVAPPFHELEQRDQPFRAAPGRSHTTPRTWH